MEIPVAKGYSIWLMFRKDDEIQLQIIINKLSSEFNSFLFKPHLTLLSGFESNNNLLKKFSDFVNGLSSFQINIKDIKYSAEFYKSVFLEVEKSDLLISLYLKASKLFRSNSNQSSFYPHISLLYSSGSEEMKMRAVQKFQEFKSGRIFVDKIALVNTEGTPDDWKAIITADIY